MVVPFLPKTVLLKPQPDMWLDVTADTHYVMVVTPAMLKKTSSYSLTLAFSVPNVSARLLVLYATGVNQNLVLTTTCQHLALNTTCTTSVKGVVRDSSSAAYFGKIIIAKGAQHTTAYLEDRVLVLGTGVKVLAEPVLEISANDVSASHGAAIGRLEPSQVYYLTTRGFSEAKAQELLIQGFFASGFDLLTDPAIVTRVKKELYVI